MPALNAPWINHQKTTVRAPVNFMDKSTIVSIYPKPIHELKPTIQPGVFDIPAGSYEKPSILVVGTSSWWKELEDSQPLLEITNSSIQVADSIVRDYANGLLGCNMGDKMPGLFYVMGCKYDKNNEVDDIATLAWIKTEHKKLLDNALVKQKNWYAELVLMADTLWSNSNGNPLSINEDMRIGAKFLNLTEKPWLADMKMMAMVNCPACGVMVRPGFPVCASCHHVVDMELYKKMNLVMAK